MITFYLKPMNSAFNNNMEMLNESTILVLSDIYMSFLDNSIDKHV